MLRKTFLLVMLISRTFQFENVYKVPARGTAEINEDKIHELASDIASTKSLKDAFKLQMKMANRNIPEAEMHLIEYLLDYPKISKFFPHLQEIIEVPSSEPMKELESEILDKNKKYFNSIMLKLLKLSRAKCPSQNGAKQDDNLQTTNVNSITELKTTLSDTYDEKNMDDLRENGSTIQEKQKSNDNIMSKTQIIKINPKKKFKKKNANSNERNQQMKNSTRNKSPLTTKSSNISTYETTTIVNEKNFTIYEIFPTSNDKNITNKSIFKQNPEVKPEISEEDDVVEELAVIPLRRSKKRKHNNDFPIINVEAPKEIPNLLLIQTNRRTNDLNNDLLTSTASSDDLDIKNTTEIDDLNKLKTTNNDKPHYHIQHDFVEVDLVPVPSEDPKIAPKTMDIVLKTPLTIYTEKDGQIIGSEDIRNMSNEKTTEIIEKETYIFNEHQMENLRNQERINATPEDKEYNHRIRESSLNETFIVTPHEVKNTTKSYDSTTKYDLKDQETSTTGLEDNTRGTTGSFSNKYTQSVTREMLGEMHKEEYSTNVSGTEGEEISTPCLLEENKKREDSFSIVSTQSVAPEMYQKYSTIMNGTEIPYVKEDLQNDENWTTDFLDENKEQKRRTKENFPHESTRSITTEEIQIKNSQNDITIRDEKEEHPTTVTLEEHEDVTQKTYSRELDNWATTRILQEIEKFKLNDEEDVKMQELQLTETTKHDTLFKSKSQIIEEGNNKRVKNIKKSINLSDESNETIELMNSDFVEKPDEYYLDKNVTNNAEPVEDILITNTYDGFGSESLPGTSHEINHAYGALTTSDYITSSEEKKHNHNVEYINENTKEDFDQQDIKENKRKNINKYSEGIYLKKYKQNARLKAISENSSVEKERKLERLKKVLKLKAQLQDRDLTTDGASKEWHNRQTTIPIQFSQISSEISKQFNLEDKALLVDNSQESVYIPENNKTLTQQYSHVENVPKHKHHPKMIIDASPRETRRQIDEIPSQETSKNDYNSEETVELTNEQHISDYDEEKNINVSSEKDNVNERIINQPSEDQIKLISNGYIETHKHQRNIPKHPLIQPNLEDTDMETVMHQIKNEQNKHLSSHKHHYLHLDGMTEDEHKMEKEIMRRQSNNHRSNDYQKYIPCNALKAPTEIKIKKKHEEPLYNAAVPYIYVQDRSEKFQLVKKAVPVHITSMYGNRNSGKTRRVKHADMIDEVPSPYHLENQQYVLRSLDSKTGRIYDS